MQTSLGTPILTPFLALLRSRAFLLALGTAIVDALIIAVPSLEPLRGDFMNTVTVLIGLVITKIAAEDISTKHEDAKVKVAAHAADAAKVVASVQAAQTIKLPSTPERP